MIKSIVNKMVTFFLNYWGYFYTYNFSCWLDRKRNTIYSLWICKFIGHVGKNVKIERHCRLEGGGYSDIRIGNNTRIQKFCILGCWKKYHNQMNSPTLSIGDDCNIGQNSQITACNRIQIGNGLLTGRYVIISDNSHGGLSWDEADILPSQRQLKSKSEVVIGNNVWIGDKVAILAGVHIGENAIIGANAVVTKDVPANTVFGGIPAKQIAVLY